MRQRSSLALIVSVSTATVVLPRLVAGRGCHSKHGSYRSGTAFKLLAHEINETNVPSAREVAGMIPSKAELLEQLPSAHELEEQYVRSPSKGMRVHLTREQPLWPKCDTVEDIMDEERYGSEEGNDMVPPPSPQHILLAWKALLWGSLYAVVGVAAVMCVAMYACGMHGVKDVLTYLHNREERDRPRLEAGGQSVTHLVLDLTNPSTLVEQVQDIWNVLEELANDETK